MYLEINENNYIFKFYIKSDFIKPMEEYMENKFIPRLQFNDNMIKIKDIEKYLKFEFSKVLLID